MKKIFGALIALYSAFAFSATTVPVQLLNPTGSTSGQAIVSTGASSAPGWSTLGVGNLAAVAANTVLANATGSSAAPTAFAMPSCTGTPQALGWTSGTGFVCNTAINATQLLGSNWASPPAIGSTTPAAGKFTTLQATSLITPTSTIGIAGTTTNDSPAAGSIGEIATNSATGTSLTNNTPANCASVSLTAGQWMVWGTVIFSPSASPTQLVAGINTTSATLGGNGTLTALSATFASAANEALATQAQVIKLASTTTVYLIGQASFTGTATCAGALNALRVR